jgi:hypothetical protein
LQRLNVDSKNEFNTKFNTHHQLTLSWPVPAAS